MLEEHEVVRMAEMELRLENAKNIYLAARGRFEELSGLRRVFGKLSLIRAAHTAEREGIDIVNGEPLRPMVVSRQYFDTIEDDMS